MFYGDQKDGTTKIGTPQGPMVIPCLRDELSDGYHTFRELDEHLDALFARLCTAHSKLSWKMREERSDNYHLAVLLVRPHYLVCNEEPGHYVSEVPSPMGRHLPLPLWERVNIKEVDKPATACRYTVGTEGVVENAHYLLGQPMPAIPEDDATTGTLYTPQGPIEVPCAVGQVRNDYESFNDLYALRHALFIALCHAYHDLAWKSKVHEDGTMFDDYFIAGIRLPEGMVTYHLPIELSGVLQVEELGAAPAWDGHTAQDVVDRLLQGL